MFYSAFDIPRGLAVWLFTEGQNTDADWDAYCDALRRAARELRVHEYPFAVQVIDPKSTDPSAKNRRQIADATAAIPAGAAIAIVSQSRVVRGAITAISWLRRPLYELHVVGSEQAAFDLASANCPERGARAGVLLAELRRESRKR